MVFALWYGGQSYSPGYVDDDTEEFESDGKSAQEFANRRANRDGTTPVVDENSEMWLWDSDPRGNPDPYPDRIIKCGPTKEGWIIVPA